MNGLNKDDIIRMAIDAIGGDMNGQDAQHLTWRLEHFKDDSYEFGPDALLKFVSLVAAATLKNSVMTDEEHEQAMADESQRTKLTFDAEVIEMVKEAVEMEREACANLLLSTDLSGLRNDLVLQNWIANLLVNYAAAIRARGQG
jgi:hypothetical protein